MNNQDAYNRWSETYDSMQNKTRDLEAEAIRKTVAGNKYNHILELGAGTGKNTLWLKSITDKLTAADFSEEMLAKAKEKSEGSGIEFVHGDITKEWNFIKEKADLITCSLILEHIKDLNHIFKEASKHLKPGGRIYIGELHPFKQYNGTKARFETETGTQILECYTHNISEYINAAIQNGFRLINLNEWFDDNDTTTIPRVITLMFEKI